MSHPPVRPTRRAGSALVLVILAIVFLGALAAGVVSFLGTANLDTAVSNLAEKVYYNAESGFRYLASRYDGQGDANGNGFADDDKAGVLLALDGATVNLPGALGSFTLDVRPYWFIATSSYTAATTITVRFPGTMPEGYALPGSGVLEVEGASLHAYTSRVVNAPNVTFTLATPATLPSGYSVYMTLPPTAAQTVSADGSLTLSSASGTVFPDRNGQIEVNGVAATYRAATHNPVSNVLTLSGLSRALNVGATDRVVLKKSALVTSTGQAGAGGFATASDVKYNITLNDDTGSGGEIESADPMFENDEVGFENLEDFHPNSSFTVAAYTSGTSSHPYYAATVQPSNSADPGSSCNLNIRHETLRLNKNSVLAQAWSNSSNLLSYDVQCKLSWGYQLGYGAGGISFRLHRDGSAYNTLGLSFMRYRHGNICSLPAWQRAANYDYIPDSIKPSTALAGSCLIVLWRQQGGQRTWLAYKTLSGDPCVLGNQWTYDGQCMTDNSVLLVRVVEKLVDGAKTSYISAYYGDASNPSNPSGCAGGSYPCSVTRTGDALSYNYPTHRTNANRNRRRPYYPSYEYASCASPYPAWPPVNLANWNATADFFSFVQHGGGSPVACSLCDWDGFNAAAGVGTAANSAFQLQADGGTLRTSVYVTPSGGTFPADRDEFGLHNFAGGGSNSAITYDEFTVQFLVPAAGSTGSVASAVQR